VGGGAGLSRPRRRRGARIAALLTGSWRPSPPDEAVVDGLDELVPLLHRLGAAALAWARLKATPHSLPSAAAGLQEAYRLGVLTAALRRRQVARVFEVFRAHGVEPILLKGWAAARLYAEEGLRPYADVDLCIPPEQAAEARRAHGAVAEECSIDLHLGLHHLDDRPLADVYERSEQVALEGGRVRILGAEDHLRLLALHMLGHGAWRPVWLADIAAALERRPASFDWARFEAGAPRRTEWAATALRLAHLLLGADVDGVPASLVHRPTPGWAMGAILDAWGFDGRRVPQGARLPMGQVRGIASLVTGLWERWPDPLEATVGVGAPINAFPRWPVQLAECVARVTRFLRAPAPGRAAAR